MKFEKTANVMNLNSLKTEQMMDNGRYKKKPQNLNQYQYKQQEHYDLVVNQQQKDLRNSSQNRKMPAPSRNHNLKQANSMNNISKY